MDVRHVALEVVAPSQYYEGIHRVPSKASLDAWLDQFSLGETDTTPTVNIEYMEMADCLAETSQSLDEFARSKTEGTLSMSLNAFAFPEEFNQIPFKNGQDVRKKCSTKELSTEGRMVRDAFAGLTPVWSQS